MIWIFICIVILSITLVTWPLWHQNNKDIKLSDDIHPVNTLLHQKENLLQSIRELDFDFETGKVSNADYQMLRQKIESETIEVLKKLETTNARWIELENKIKASISILLLTLLIPCFAHADTIKGQVRILQGSEKTPAVQQSVQLDLYKNGRMVAGSKTLTDAQGNYKFTMEPASNNWFYRVSVPYKEVFFYSDYFMETQTQVPEIMISEPTGSLQDIKIVEVVFFEFGSGTLAKITHQLQIQNSGTTTYHPKMPQAEPLVIDLLEGGFNLSLVEGLSRDEMSVDEESHTMHLPLILQPNVDRDIRFSYMIPLDQRTIEISKQNLTHHKSLHFISNRESIRMPSKYIQSMEIPTSLATNFTTAFEVNMPINNLTAHMRGIKRPKDVYYLWTLLACLTVVLLLFIFFAVTRKDKNEESIDNIESMIRALLQAPSTEENRLKIDLLKRRLYHMMYKSI
ncbi:MAG: hypothetical protein KDD46_05785 [Bdellovibrionales bacterium]|nr:hypothetical protein [Bdellovibrionales bacterium]